MTPPPLLSVVVIGRNEGDRLLRCLASIRAMHLDGEVEILYVDSASTDGSPQAATAAGATVIALQTTSPTAALGRNAGWRTARAQTILFLDGDTVLHPDFVQQALPSLNAPEVAVVWGHRRELHPEHSIYNRVLDLDWVYAPGLTPFCGGDALFRRSALQAAAGFDETLIAGEEPELCRRLLALDYRILHVDLPMTGHDLDVRRFGQYWRRATRAGHAYAQLADRFRSTANPFWTAEADRNRRRALLLTSVPILSLLLSLLLQAAWPFLSALLLLLLLALRTAWRSRWKAASPLTLVLYGLHSHLQQIPIFAGQLRFRHNQRAGRTGRLLEYK